MAAMQGEDFEQFLLTSAAEVAAKTPLIERIWTQHRQLRASMLQDLEKGRDTEINYINGVVRDTGRQFGIPTPFNDRVIELVVEAQSRRQIPTFSNINRFDDLLASRAGQAQHV